jgi:hypothetical protein
MFCPLASGWPTVNFFDIEADSLGVVGGGIPRLADFGPAFQGPLSGLASPRRPQSRYLLAAGGSRRAAGRSSRTQVLRHPAFSASSSARLGSVFWTNHAILFKTMGFDGASLSAFSYAPAACASRPNERYAWAACIVAATSSGAVPPIAQRPASFPLIPRRPVQIGERNVTRSDAGCAFCACYSSLSASGNLFRRASAWASTSTPSTSSGCSLLFSRPNAALHRSCLPADQAGRAHASRPHAWASASAPAREKQWSDSRSVGFHRVWRRA